MPVREEEAMIAEVIRWGEGERGMMKDQPEWRIPRLQEACRRNGMSVIQACSLRRHHLKRLNPFMTMQQLKLGSFDDIREAAEIFENTVAHFLRENHVPYIGEKEQKRRKISAYTPDFLMREPIELQWRNNNFSSQPHKTFWIEAKMFYGASSIPDGEKSAVGNILGTARKYTNAFGPGVMVFSCGCGSRLAGQLRELGVIAVDADSLDLSPLIAHQSKWCGAKNGMILP